MLSRGLGGDHMLKAWFLIGASLAVFSLSHSAFGTEVLQTFCAEDFGQPQVTRLDDGQILICSSFPTAYVSDQTAARMALELNSNEAMALCPEIDVSRIHNHVLKERAGMTVISVFKCL